MLPGRRMEAPDWRYVTPAERNLIGEVFGRAVAPARVRVFCLPFFDRIFTPGSWGIVYPHRQALWDFTEGGLDDQATFVHEFTHVWQAQHGKILPFEKLFRSGDDAAAYDYSRLAELDFPRLNIEQQASFVEHAFKLSRGGRAPLEIADYDRWRPHYYQA